MARKSVTVDEIECEIDIHTLMVVMDDDGYEATRHDEMKTS